MPDSLPNRIIEATHHAASRYQRLVLVVAPSGAGKTQALQQVAERLDAPLVNVNLELSRRLLEVPTDRRSLRAAEVFAEVLAEVSSDVVLLDNLEILFEASLALDPLRLLQLQSRNRTLVASWNGQVVDGYLIYAEPHHPEYRRCSAAEVLYVTPRQADK